MARTAAASPLQSRAPCISYLTSSSAPHPCATAADRTAYGCETAQQLPGTALPVELRARFRPPQRLDAPRSPNVLEETEFGKRTEGSATAGLDSMLRNIAWRSHARQPAGGPALASVHQPRLVREHVPWALSRHGS